MISARNTPQRRKYQKNIAAFLLPFLVSATAVSAVVFPKDPLVQLAESYQARYQYQQAYPLWEEIVKRYPRDPAVAIRVSELKLLFENREASRQLLTAMLAEPTSAASGEAGAALRAALSKISSVFLTDEGQSSFAQAEVKARHQEYEKALPLLNQAALLEKGNFKVTSLKAHCEKQLGAWEVWYETIKVAHTENPVDEPTRDALAEGHLYFKSPKKTIALLKDKIENSKSNQLRLIYAMALLDSGDLSTALPLFQKIIERNRSQPVSPVVFYGAAKALESRPHRDEEAQAYYEKFLSLTPKASPTEPKAWDPFRGQERREEVETILKTS